MPALNWRFGASGRECGEKCSGRITFVSFPRLFSVELKYFRSCSKNENILLTFVSLKSIILKFMCLKMNKINI